MITIGDVDVQKVNPEFLEKLAYLAENKKRMNLLWKNGFMYVGNWSFRPQSEGYCFTRLYKPNRNGIMLIPEFIILYQGVPDISYCVYSDIMAPSIPRHLDSHYYELISGFDRRGYRTYPEHGIYEIKMQVEDEKSSLGFCLMNDKYITREDNVVLQMIHLYHNKYKGKKK